MRTLTRLLTAIGVGCSAARPRISDPDRRSWLVAAALAAIASFIPPQLAASPNIEDYAVSAWATAPVSAAPADANRLNNQTVRQIVNLSVGGDKVRIKFSNRYGTAPFVVTSAAVSVRSAGDAVVPGTTFPLTFGGMSSFTIPINGELYSDWVDLRVAGLIDLVIDLYVPGDTSASTSPLTLHNARPMGQLLSYLAEGNQVGATTFPTVGTRTQWYFITGVDIAAPKAVGVIVAFGDSITDGSASTVGTNTRWPDFLARRLAAQTEIRPMGVPNLGIGGNRMLIGGTGENALARFDRDALVQTGATHVIVLLGINDISGLNTADRIIEGHRQLIKRAHARGLKIYGGTVTPFANAPDAREAQRLILNEWIRTSGAYDAVIDFDAAIRDPADPRRMLPIYDSGDTLHPNSAGYEAMANSIDLNLFRP